MKDLVIVESPTKARTLTRFLGNEYEIIASMGHIRDLPKSELGIEVTNNFAPRYIIPRDKKKQVNLIKKQAEGRKQIILATDPDREGEAIAYHIKQVISSNEKIENKNEKFIRVVFHEITKEAINDAFKHPRDIDIKLYDAQQGRRILDRLVGYSLSPVLWYKIKKGLSAGRVQSSALRLIVDREKEINSFVPQEYWDIQVELQKDSQTFIAALIKIRSEKVLINNQEHADKILKDLNKAQYVVNNIEVKEINRNASPPFTTSTLQQTASNRLGFSSRQTMRLAQNLYEEGYITYHRTDSVNIAGSAIEMVRKYIHDQYGQEYLPAQPVYFKTKTRGAQEAHESIRPTDVSRKEIGLTSSHQKLYQMIWQRFVACQMKEALYSQSVVDVKAGDYLFRAVGTTVVFPGWRIIYGVSRGDLVSENGDSVKLPKLSVGELLRLLKLIPLQKFTQPPARYTEAALIKSLEENGIGRPSTYAPIIMTLFDRIYIEKEERKLKPTDLGILVSDFLVKYFPKIVDITFTAQMENKLDEIAEGKSQWQPVIKEFYAPFERDLKNAQEKAEKANIPVEETGEKCPLCASALVFRMGKFGKFVACSTFPNCKYTKQYVEKAGMPCPLCNGDVIIKKTAKGRPFYGCSNYPKCKFASWQKPNNIAESSKQPEV